jgi:hypothetical protein
MDVSAYRWNGNALGAQYKRDGASLWDVKRGIFNVGVVVLRDGRFTNYSAGPVLVAAWCESTD